MRGGEFEEGLALKIQTSSDPIYRSIGEELMKLHPMSNEMGIEVCHTCQWDVDCGAPQFTERYPCPTMIFIGKAFGISAE